VSVVLEMSTYDAESPPNRILRTDSEGGEAPRRAYARVDSVERMGIEQGEVLAYLDAVDASWFDEQPADRPFGEASRHMPASVFSWAADDSETLAWELPQPGSWLEVNRDEATSSVSLQHFSSLFADPIDVRASLRPIAPDLSIRLNRAFSLADVQEATPDEIRDAMVLRSDGPYITVLDVGQGGAIEVEGDGRCVYFDFGGGVLGNQRTFPKRFLSKECVPGNATVVLSHWDWDHWSSAMRLPHIAFDWNWIVPRQPLGAVHRAFAWELIARNRLRIWPDDVAHVESDALSVERCIGTTQNDSGLAMTVFRRKPFRTRRRVLLPGDAEYDAIPSLAARRTFDAAVVSHHGSQLESIEKLRGHKSRGVLVYSYGSGNLYGHPRLHAQLSYLRSGWHPDRTLATTQSTRRRPCNIGINLGKSRSRYRCGLCGTRVSATL
jgi:beta-lactamase superfamily II metal-dependent hydrolase